MWTYIIAGLAALAMIATITIKVDDYLDEVKESGRVEVRAEWLAASEKRRQREQAKATAAAEGLAADRAKRKAKSKPLLITVEKILEKPIYLNECIEPAGLSCVNAALGGKSTDGCKPGARVPGPVGALRWAWQIGGEQVN